MLMKNKESYLDNIFRNLREKKILRFISKNDTLCDLGCGSNGSLLYFLANNIKEGVGVDYSVRPHKLANLTFIKANLEKKLKLNPNKFDVVTVLAVLEHLNKPENLLNEAYRVLKKNGKLILTTPSKLSKPILEFLARLNLINRRHIKEHKNYFSKKELTDLLKNAGFKDIKVSAFEFGMNNLAIAKK